MDFEIIIQECFLGDPLPKLLKRFRYVEQNGNKTFCPLTISSLVVSPLVVSPLKLSLVVSPLDPGRFNPQNVRFYMLSYIYYFSLLNKNALLL